MLRYLVFVAPITLTLSTAALAETPQAAASGVATTGDFAGPGVGFGRLAIRLANH